MRYWAALLMTATLAACEARRGTEETRLEVVVTVPAVGMWIEAIGGDLVDVRLLLPPGASPHVWQPSARDLRTLADAPLAVFAGGGLEPWASEVMRASATTRRDLVLVEWLQSQGLIEEPDGRTGSHGDHGHHHAEDPHVWLSPRLARAVCPHLLALLTEAAPGRREALTAHWAANAAQVEGALTLCEERRASLSSLRVIQFHRSWENLARDAGFTVVGTIEPTPGVEPSPRAMRALIDMAQRERANAVIAEPQLNPAAAQRLAAALDIPLAVLDPYGQRGETYVEFIRRNLDALAAAVSPEAP